jgi:hypothetical protein
MGLYQAILRDLRFLYVEGEREIKIDGKSIEQSMANAFAATAIAGTTGVRPSPRECRPAAISAAAAPATPTTAAATIFSTATTNTLVAAGISGGGDAECTWVAATSSILATTRHEQI